MATETIERRREGEIIDDAQLPDESGRINDGLHLPSLRIHGFRCFEEFEISRLGRVNLIAGRNGIGKSTLLDAVRVYAERGSGGALARVLSVRDELDDETDEPNEGRGVDWSALFYGRELETDRSIRIGPSGDHYHGQLSIKPVFGMLPEDEGATQADLAMLDEPLTHLQVSMNGSKRYIRLYPARHYRYGRIRGERSLLDRHLRRSHDDGIPAAIVCGSHGPDVTRSPELADLLDEVALTNSVRVAMELVQVVVNREIVAVAAVGGRRRSPTSARVLVRVADSEQPIPLRSLGDGAVRAFCYALAMANASGGILLIDEIENGIHHAVLPRFWKMMFEASRDQNVQVFATTHSYDCVSAFAKIVSEGDIEDAALIRIDKTRITNRDRAVEYSIDSMIAAAKFGIEVR